MTSKIPLKILSAADVRSLLQMRDCIDVMADAMDQLSAGTVNLPLRIIAPLADSSGFLAVMPGSALKPAVYGAKVVGLHPTNPAKGLPTIQGLVALFDHETGTPLCILEGAQITGIRTAAASGLATRLLAREDVRSHGVFGAGVQAPLHIDAIQAARPGVERVRIWARDAKKAESLAEAERLRTGLDVRAVADPEAAGACDIISAVTASNTPVLNGAWLKPGAHVNLVGSHSPTGRESDSDVVRGAAIFVDLRKSAMAEAGDLLLPIAEGVITTDDILAEIGDVAAGRAQGRRNDQQTTVYKSLGIAAQDLYAAWFVYRRACEFGRGVDAPF